METEAAGILPPSLVRTGSHSTHEEGTAWSGLMGSSKNKGDKGYQMYMRLGNSKNHYFTYASICFRMDLSLWWNHDDVKDERRKQCLSMYAVSLVYTCIKLA